MSAFRQHCTFLLAGLVISAMLVGCQQPADISPPAGLGDPYPAPMNDPQLAVLSPDLRPWLGFHQAIIVHEPGEPMFVQQPVRNLAERMYLVDYRILFYDADGLEMPGAMSWTMVSLQPKETTRLKANSLDPAATNYRVEVKWAR